MANNQLSNAQRQALDRQLTNINRFRVSTSTEIFDGLEHYRYPASGSHARRTLTTLFEAIEQLTNAARRAIRRVQRLEPDLAPAQFIMRNSPDMQMISLQDSDWNPQDVAGEPAPLLVFYQLGRNNIFRTWQNIRDRLQNPTNNATVMSVEQLFTLGRAAMAHAGYIYRASYFFDNWLFGRVRMHQHNPGADDFDVTELREAYNAFHAALATMPEVRVARRNLASELQDMVLTSASIPLFGPGVQQARMLIEQTRRTRRNNSVLSVWGAANGNFQQSPVRGSRDGDGQGRDGQGRGGQARGGQNDPITF